MPNPNAGRCAVPVPSPVVRFHCPVCGTDQAIRWEDCASGLARRQYIAAEFMVDGHAAVDADTLVTFDSKFYETNVPSVSVLPG